MIDQIIKKMAREVENCPESSFFWTGIILDVGVKRYYPPSDTELLRALHFRNTKNIRNPLIFLQKMASYSCFWRVQGHKSSCKQVCIGLPAFWPWYIVS